MKTTRTIRKEIKTYLEINDLYEFGMRLSLILPHKTDTICERVFVFYEIKDKEKHKVSEPVAYIDITNESIISYQTIGSFEDILSWEEYVPQMLRDSKEKIIEELFDVYDRIKESLFQKKAHLCEGIIKDILRYKELFNEFVAEPLIQYYQQYGKDFFEWLDQM